MIPFRSLLLGTLGLAVTLILVRWVDLGVLAPYLIPVTLLYLPLLCDPHMGRQELGFHLPTRRSLFLFLSSIFIFLGGMFVITSHLLAWAWKGFTLNGLWLVLGGEIAFRAFPEEFFFRGWFQKRLEMGWNVELFRFSEVGISGANLIVSLLFALLHWISFGGPERLLVFFPSLWFGWLRSAGGGILLPVIAHALSNLMVLWGLGQ